MLHGICLVAFQAHQVNISLIDINKKCIYLHAKIIFYFYKPKTQTTMSTILNRVLLIVLLFRSFNMLAQDYQSVEVADNIKGVQPMTGIIFWTDSEYKSSDAIAMEYSYMLYSDVVSKKGVYNWKVVDELLKDVASRNHQAVLRFRYSYPGYQTAVPQYIKDMSDYKETVGKSEGLTTYFPDWTHSELKRFTLEFYEKFAERYDNDSRLAFIQTGFGLWAEYHIYDGPFELGQTFPDKSFQEEFFNQLESVFTNKTWSISIDAADGECSPFESKPELKNIDFGLFDDSFMHEEHNDYNEWCWDFFGRDRYKNHPAGGEFSYYSDYDQEHVLDPKGPYGIPFETFVEDFHMSYIIGSDQPQYQSIQRIKEASMCMGYKFKIVSFQTATGSSLVKITNVGVAPIYCDAYVAVNGVRSQTSLKYLCPGSTITSNVDAGGQNAVLTIESDNILATQEIGYLGNKGEVVPEEPVKYSLTTIVVGEGTISSSGGYYDTGSNITLTATPAEGWQFVKWSGSVSSTENPLTLKMESDISVTATFVEILPVEYTLNTTINGSGSLVLNPDGGKYTKGTVVGVTAVSAEGWQFDKWEGSALGDDNPVYITMNSDKDLQVFFSEVEENPKYTLSIENSEQGNVTLNPKSDYYDEGAKVILTAVAQDGWEFDKWEGSISTNDNPTTITMDGDKNIKALFVEKDEVEQYILYIDTYGDGEVLIDPEYETYDAGSKVTITAIAEDGWAFDMWEGSIEEYDNPLTITMDEDMYVDAVFYELDEDEQNNFSKGEESEGYQYYKFSCSATNNSWFLVRNIDLVGKDAYYNLSTWWYEYGMPSTIEKKIDLGSPVIVNSIQITPGWYSNCAPRDFRVEGSNDNTSWILLFEQNNLPTSVWTSKRTKTFDFSENEILEYVSGIDNISGSQSLLYPNPTKGLVYISPDIDSKNVKIMNLMGQVVLNVNPTKKMFDLSELKSGMYIVKINDTIVSLVKE